MTANSLEILTARIKAAVDAEKLTSHQKGSVKTLRKALSEIRWTLKEVGSDRYLSASQQGLACSSKEFTTELHEAAVYDGRDNEIQKLEFFELLLSTKLEIVLLP